MAFAELALNAKLAEDLPAFKRKVLEFFWRSAPSPSLTDSFLLLLLLPALLHANARDEG